MSAGLAALVCLAVAVIIVAQRQIAAAALVASNSSGSSSILLDWSNQHGLKPHVERRALPYQRQENKDRIVDVDWSPADFVKENALGRGGFGTAYLSYLDGAVWLAEPGGRGHRGLMRPLVFVVKEAVLATNREREDFINEANFLKVLDSPFILKLYGYYVVKKRRYFRLTGFEYLGHLITEYAIQGDLYAAIKKQGRLKCPGHIVVITERQAMRYVVQVLLGLKEMHERGSGGIGHNDIKTNNIFLAENNVAKIGDLGLSCRITQDNPNVDVFCVPYAAPEVRQKKINQLPEKERLKRDTWALGVTLHEMLTDKMIVSTNEMRSRWISRDMDQLIRLMLIEDPYSRPGVAELLRHPTVRKHYERLDSSNLRTRQTPEIKCYQSNWQGSNY